jgi:hypothetical protein
MRLIRRLILVAFAVSLPTIASAQQQQPNGIAVGRPKIYDNRTLTIMLESLGQTLQGMQSFVSQTTIAGALANLQGTRTTEDLASVSIKELPLPQSKTTAFTPTAPTIADAPALTGFTPTFGGSAGDLLSDQINLSYQIFNLRMILERSLSDRLVGDEPRLQAVLGFNVTLDPPRTAVDAVAVVEITLKAASGGPLELVAMMPQEKTYNAATLSTKSREFGGTAVANVFELGASTRRRSQTFFLYRDNDTVAYERMNSDKPEELVFGWMFRPVLGRRSISPGFRQMLAVAALPLKDLCRKPCDCKSESLDAEVRTYWKKYDVNTMTSFETHDANRGTRFKYAATFGLTRPELFETRYLNTGSYKKIIVKPTSEFDTNLGPSVERVTWTPVGPKTVLVSAVGKNFFSGTQLILGDKKYTGADGLVLKSSNAFDVIVPMDALNAGPAIISGRYGAAVPFEIETSAITKFPEILLFGAKVGTVLAGRRTIEVQLRKPTLEDPQPLALAELPDPSQGAPLVTINGTAMPLPYEIFEKGGTVTIKGNIADSLAPGSARVVRVSWPFFPKRLTVQALITDPVANFELSKLGAKIFLLHTKEKRGFVNAVDRTPLPMSDLQKDPLKDSCWHVVFGTADIPLQTDRCTAKMDAKENHTVKVTTHDVTINFKDDPPEKLLLVTPEKTVFSLDVPKGDAAAAAAAATPKQTEVNQFDSVFIDIAVANAAKVTAVEANQLALKFRPKPDDEKKIQVLITRDLTAQPGNIDIMITDDTKTTASRLVIKPCANCQTAEKK